jgi:hypothetical protein
LSSLFALPVLLLVDLCLHHKQVLLILLYYFIGMGKAGEEKKGKKVGKLGF